MSGKRALEAKAAIRSSDIFPARFILTGLVFWGMCLIFAHRVCLNVAMVAMVNATIDKAHIDQQEVYNTSFENEINDQCPLPSEMGQNSSFNYQKGTYLWSPSSQGLILGSYFYGYVSGQLIGGRLADFIGAKWLFGGATLISSLLTLVTPRVAATEIVYALIGLRVVLGFIHGMNYPSAYCLLAKWAPVQERSTMLSICVIGTHFGVVFSMPLTGYLCEYGFEGGWPSAFYVLGIIGCLWFFGWSFLVFDSPTQHPRITDNEREYIQNNLSTSNDKEAKKNVPTPWMKVFLSPPFWAVTVAKFTGAWSFICFQAKLPAYMDEVLHFPIQKNGLVNALLFGVLCLSLVTCGIASDFIRNKNTLSTTRIRKVFEAIALLGPATCLVAIPEVGCDADSVVTLLTVAMALFGFCGGGDVSVIVDFAPDFAGRIFGVSNAIASVPGILAPIVAGIFLEGTKGNIAQWTNIFYISVGMYLIGAIIFLIFGSAETQSWGVIRSYDQKLDISVIKSHDQKPDINGNASFSRVSTASFTWNEHDDAEMKRERSTTVNSCWAEEVTRI